MVKLHFSRKYDGSARKQLKIQPCRVSTLAVQLDTLHICPLVSHSCLASRWAKSTKGLPPVSFRGKQTPATGVNKCINPDEGTLNEVSSLANEKFISSRNKYGAKGKAVLVSGKPNSQVYLATHKINGSTPRKSATGESPGKTDS